MILSPGRTKTVLIGSDRLLRSSLSRTSSGNCLAAGLRHHSAQNHKRIPSSNHASCKAGACTWPNGDTGQHKRRKRRPLRVQASSSYSYKPFPFDESDYYKIKFCPHPVGPIVMFSDTGNSVLTFHRVGDPPDKPDTGCIEVFIGGDTARGIYHLCTDKQPERPLVMDLLWTILQRGQQLSKRDWKLIRVAIVAIRDGAYIGRLFFGDADSGKVLWDVDCRPSDGCWLALKAGAPLYVHRDVWDQYSGPLGQARAWLAAEELKRRMAAPVVQQQQQTKDAKDLKEKNSLLDKSVWGMQPNDMDVIKLLKREMEVAVKEEDYTGAIAIRDHPYMKLYAQIVVCRQRGDMQLAQELEAKLGKLIADAELSSRSIQDK